MRVLLVEPQYRRGAKQRTPKKRVEDESLWYPPLGLLKLARYHKERGDEVLFASGLNHGPRVAGDLFGPPVERVYITTLFTFHFDTIVKTINYYRDLLGGTGSRIFVGGIMASLMPEDLFEATGIFPHEGLLTSSRALGLAGEDVNIDSLAPDYTVLDGSLYAVNETFYAYATRGCPNSCPWCGVKDIEPEYAPYLDIKPMVTRMRSEYGDLPILKLMDNNVLASDRFTHIVEDLLSLGYGRGQYTGQEVPRLRVIDFNQGVDARHMTPENTALLAKLSVRPLRVAFDNVNERESYVKAVRLAASHGFANISNYMLFNFKDAPRDLYERLMVNIALNEEFASEFPNSSRPTIYSYPMRFAPIHDNLGGSTGANRRRDHVQGDADEGRNWLENPVWTRRFIRNVEIMKGAAHGAISSTPSLARRTIGETFEEFLANLYMPEKLLRYRNRYERKVYDFEPERAPGTGDIEEFRRFILGLLSEQSERFFLFHRAVSRNLVSVSRKAVEACEEPESKKWLKIYTETN